MPIATLLSCLGGAAAMVAHSAGQPVDTVKTVFQDYAEANAALMKGDAGTWARRTPMTEDFVLFSPFGGEPSRRSDYPPERIERMGRLFDGGTFDHELVQAFQSDDMIVLATIERSKVRVGGLPRQEWALRVTSVFRRSGEGWKLAHRHADPFVVAVPLAESARIARGERPSPAK